MAYNFIDGYGSVLAADSSIVSGSGVSGLIRPIVHIGSVLGAIPTTFSGAPSISGTVNIGNAPSVYGNIAGSVVAFQGGAWTASVVGNVGQVGTRISSISGVVDIAGSVAAILTGNPSISGQVGASIIGTVPVVQSGTFITSIVSTVPSSVLVGASIIGLTPVNVTNTNINVSGSVVASGFPTNQNISGSVVAFQGTAEWIVKSSISGGIFPISGSVAATITNTNINVGGSVVAFGFPTNQNVSGSIVAFQGTTPWNIAGSVAAVRTGQSGTLVTSVVGNVGQSGAWSASIITAPAPTTAVTSLASSTSNGTLLTANTARKGATIMNVAATSVMVKLGTTATALDYTVLMQDQDYYELPANYSGRVDVIGSSTAGIIRITEITG